jgi:iron(III) transport system substrate-binding protein
VPSCSKANQHYATLLGQVAMTGIEGQNPHYPTGVAQSMIGVDVAWTADNRARILAEWAKRYGAKAAAR